MNSLSVIQANVQFSRTATIETLQYIAGKNIDIAIIQEPYCYKNKNNDKYVVPAIGRMKLCAVNNERFYACIIVNNSNLDLIFNAQLSDVFKVSITLDTQDQMVDIISIYRPPNADLQEYIIGLGESMHRPIAQNNKTHEIILAGDFNCRSTVWFDVVNHRDAGFLEDFILAYDLAVCNGQNFPPTFETINGQSNIDLTLATGGLVEAIVDWEVVRDINSADHNCIKFVIRKGEGRDAKHQYILDPSQLNLEYVFVKIREIVIEVGQLPPPNSPHAIDNIVNTFHRLFEQKITKTARVRKYPNRPQWWTHRVERLRRVYLAKKKILYNNRFQGDREYLYNQMTEFKNKFKQAMEQARKSSWKSFVEEDLGRNPWGTVYRLASEKFRKKGILCAINQGIAYTRTPEETMSYILNNLLPDENVQDPTQLQLTRTRDFDTLRPILPRGDYREVTEEELDGIVFNLGNKAPGHDLIKGKLIKAIYSEIKVFLLNIYNACFSCCYFPELWKRGELVVLLKNPDENHANIKNYRPVTLLPEFGKILERLIKGRLTTLFPRLHSHRQYGFTGGLSTTDALKEYINTIKNSNRKYIATIFVDISGAFNDMWWPELIHAMRVKGIPHNDIAMVKSYLQNRKVSYRENNICIGKNITKGCPQGSVLGPTLWNIMLDGLLEGEMLQGFKTIAYADDIAMIIESDMRVDLVNQLGQAVDAITTWTSQRQLTISTTKTKIMINKTPSRQHHRDIHIRINGQLLNITDQYKYLGLIIDNRLNFTEHVRVACKKAIKIAMALRRKIQATWDMDFTESMTTIYNCAIVPMVAYGLEIWGDRLSNTGIVRRLRSLQATFCRVQSRCYCTVSNEAASVMAGIPPLDLELASRLATRHWRVGRDEIVCLGQVLVRAEIRSVRALKQIINRRIKEIWQQQWDTSDKGRVTYSFFPTVPERPRSFSFHLSELLTGHGPFRAHLNRIGKLESGACPDCPMAMDDPLHRIYLCPRYTDARNNVLIQIPEWPLAPNELVNYIHLPAFMDFLLDEEIR